jgi:hypothetical protein
VNECSEAMQITELELWREHHKELLREAQSARLARLMLAQRPKLALETQIFLNFLSFF